MDMGEEFLKTGDIWRELEAEPSTVDMYLRCLGLEFRCVLGLNLEVVVSPREMEM